MDGDLSNKTRVERTHAKIHHCFLLNVKTWCTIYDIHPTAIFKVFTAVVVYAVLATKERKDEKVREG